MSMHWPTDWLGIATFLVIFVVATQYLWDRLLLDVLPKNSNTVLKFATVLRYIIALLLVISAVFAGIGIWKEVTA